MKKERWPLTGIEKRISKDFAPTRRKIRKAIKKLPKTVTLAEALMQVSEYHPAELRAARAAIRRWRKATKAIKGLYPNAKL